MKLRTRVSIVVFTLGSCLWAACIELGERLNREVEAPFLLFDAVQSQLTAIRAHHYQEAYLRASRQFMDSTDLECFIQKNRGSDAVLRHAVRWEFGIPSVCGEKADVPVNFFLPSGELIPANYELIWEGRAWKIDSVRVCENLPPRSAGGIRL